jgi:cytochrome c-type biogenesis protein CcmH/NrfG
MSERVCRQCGSALIAADKYCGACGASAAGTGGKKRKKSKKQATRKSMPVAYPVITGVLVVAVCLLAISMGDREASTEHVHTQAPQVSQQNMAVIQGLQQRIDANPQDAEALIQLGNTFYDMQNNSEAIRYYQRALEIEPDNTDVRVDMGVCYFREKEYDSAITEMLEAVRINPRHATAWFNLGIVANQAGKKADAITYWKKFLELAPTSPNAAQVRDFLKQWETRTP